MAVLVDAAMVRAADGGFRLVGVVSVAFGCPFEGPVPAARVADLAARLLQSRKYPSWGYEIEQGATTIWESWSLIAGCLSFST